jgi:hypothetical protein
VNDLKDLLELAVQDTPAVPVDPSADVARGRRLLRRRLRFRASGVVAAVAVGAMVPVVLHSAAGTGAGGHQAAASVSHKAVHSVHGATRQSAPVHKAASIALVAWQGSQPPGYQVSWMPSGWVVQGSTPFALTIAPPGDTDTNADSFLGKLVVMLQSSSVTSPPTGISQPVNGRQGVFMPYQDGIESLTFQNANGQWVVVQSPQVLGWDPAQLAKFAGGVQVLVTAQQGVG